MRVLHLDCGRSMRGGQWQVLYLAEDLCRTGHEAVIMARRSGPLAGEALRRGLVVRPLRLSTLPAESSRFDVVHAHDARAHTLAVLLARAPVVVSRRVAFPLRRTPLSRWKYARAAHYLAVSEFVRGRLMRGGVPAAKISVVYDGVPAASPSEPGTLLVAPATADPRKGSALAREAASVAGLPIHFSANLAEDLRRAALFVYITHEEGLGSAILLAMAAGVPVLASRVGGIPEVVEDGVTGVLVENSPPAIAGGLRRLWEDRGLAIELASRARERARARFSVERMAKETLRVYERILSC